MSTYITADIHASFTALWQRLRSLGFNPQQDVLYSLGDLVNRGEESSSVIAWLQKPWFKAIRGNHEAMVIEAWANPQNEENLALLRSVNGGWWFDLSKTEQEQIANGLASLPFCRTIEVAGQRIGLVHGDVPDTMPWSDYADLLQQNDADAVEQALWGRGRWRDAIEKGVPHEYLIDVPGVDWVFLGHSPVDSPTFAGNVVFADCGLWRGNTNGVFCLDDWLQARA